MHCYTSTMVFVHRYTSRIIHHFPAELDDSALKFHAMTLNLWTSSSKHFSPNSTVIPVQVSAPATDSILVSTTLPELVQVFATAIVLPQTSANHIPEPWSNQSPGRFRRTLLDFPNSKGSRGMSLTYPFLESEGVPDDTSIVKQVQEHASYFLKPKEAHGDPSPPDQIPYTDWIREDASNWLISWAQGVLKGWLISTSSVLNHFFNILFACLPPWFLCKAHLSQNSLVRIFHYVFFVVSKFFLYCALLVSFFFVGFVSTLFATILPPVLYKFISNACFSVYYKSCVFLCCITCFQPITDTVASPLVLSPGSFLNSLL